MIDTIALAKRANSWQNIHPPNTGYTKKVFDQLGVRARSGQLAPGTNLMVEAMLQYDGAETVQDQLRFDVPERRLPYSQTSRLSLDDKVDCSSFPYIMFKIFLDLNIGTYTEGQYAQIPKIGGFKIPWADRRPLDIVQYLFPGSTHPHVSHTATYIGDGKIIHTTSAANPMRVEADTYSASRRVCVWRIPQAHTGSLIVPAIAPWGIFQHAMWYSKPPFEGEDVRHYQEIVKAFLLTKQDTYARYLGGLLKVNGTFGLVTHEAVKRAQRHLGLPTTGGIDYQTAAAFDHLT